MELILRPYVTAGVVLAGAGLLAAVPIGPSAPGIQTRAVQLVSVDDLGDPTSAASLAEDQEYPLATWTDAYNDTVSNLQMLDAQMAADPHPILSAIDANFTGYANDLASAAQLSSSNLANVLQDLSTVLTNATGDLQAGDVYDAETSIWQFLLDEPGSVSQPFESAYFYITQSMVNNLDNVLSPGGLYFGYDPSDLMNVFAVPEWFTDLQDASLYGPNAAEYAMAGVAQDVIDAYQDGDYTLALSDISNAGSTIVDAYFNGYPEFGGGGGERELADFAAARIDPTEGALNGGSENVLRAREIVAGDLGGLERAQEAAATASSTGDLNSVGGDVSTLLNQSTALGEIATAFDPNAVADISSLLSGDLAPNASGWVVDLLSAF